MDVRHIEYRRSMRNGDFDIEARYQDVRVGQVQGIRTGDRLFLADIHVEKEMHRAWPVLPRLLLSLLGRRRPWNLRGRGIGRELLTGILKAADSAGIRTIWGRVTADDLKETPGLLDWYRRYGFAVSDPDEECRDHDGPVAVKKIVRQR